LYLSLNANKHLHEHDTCYDLMLTIFLSSWSKVSRV